MNAAVSAVQEQVLKDNISVMDGGYLALRGGQYRILSPKSNQHHIDASAFIEARDRGYAVMDAGHNIHVTAAGWAFAGRI